MPGAPLKAAPVLQNDSGKNACLAVSWLIACAVYAREGLRPGHRCGTTDTWAKSAAEVGGHLYGRFCFLAAQAARCSHGVGMPVLAGP
jgi:hypothetical protein